MFLFIGKESIESLFYDREETWEIGGEKEFFDGG